MCGIIAIFSSSGFVCNAENLSYFLKRQAWRGPDHIGIWIDESHRACLGHNRLTILDASPLANMPMPSRCGRYLLVYNGEIYNHNDLRDRFQLQCTTHSDSETLINLYAKIGPTCVSHLEGMFAFAIFDTLSGRYFAARDQLGIKPLYYSEHGDTIVFGSEPAVVNDIVGGSPSEIAIKEWQVFRRPIGGRTFFKKVFEVPPGCYYESETGLGRYWRPHQTRTGIDYEEFRTELASSVSSHLLNDYETVSLLSGGLDSAIILGLSRIKKCYTIGLTDNNEFDGAEESAATLGARVVQVEITSEELRQAWRTLLNDRREPLSVPNEGLIYRVCKSMTDEEKVVLTGEGADELLFGYDRIFRWGSGLLALSIDQFLERYAYSGPLDLEPETLDYIADLMRGKSPIDFLEDFFIDVHLPGLLRRMDGASMCASKEARVPFVTARLFNLVYRQPIQARYFDGYPKSPLRRLANEMHLNGAIARKKIGFSASFLGTTPQAEYQYFQNFCISELDWSPDGYRIHNRSF